MTFVRSIRSIREEDRRLYSSQGIEGITSSSNQNASLVLLRFNLSPILRRRDYHVFEPECWPLTWTNVDVGSRPLDTFQSLDNDLRYVMHLELPVRAPARIVQGICRFSSEHLDVSVRHGPAVPEAARHRPDGPFPSALAAMPHGGHLGHYHHVALLGQDFVEDVADCPVLLHDYFIAADEYARPTVTNADFEIHGVDCAFSVQEECVQEARLGCDPCWEGEGDAVQHISLVVDLSLGECLYHMPTIDNGCTVAWLEESIQHCRCVLVALYDHFRLGFAWLLLQEKLFLDSTGICNGVVEAHAHSLDSEEVSGWQTDEDVLN